MKTSERLHSLRKEIEVAIFGGRGYSYDNLGNWSVQLKYHNKGTIIEVTERGNDLEATLDTAWAKIDSIAKTGLPLGALNPPVEHTLIEASPPAPQAVPFDDEIPF